MVCLNLGTEQIFPTQTTKIRDFNYHSKIIICRSAKRLHMQHLCLVNMYETKKKQREDDYDQRQQ